MQFDELALLDTPIFWVYQGSVGWMNSSARALLRPTNRTLTWAELYPKLPHGYIFRLHHYAAQGASGIVVEGIPDTRTNLLEELQDVKQENGDLKRILDASLDEVFVTDASGVAIHVNEISAELYGMNKSEILGRSVYELERERVFYPSAISLALREKKRVTVLQTTFTGQRLIATASPVFDSHGELIQVVSSAKDITNLNLYSWPTGNLSRATDVLEEQAEGTTRMVHKSSALQELLLTCERLAKTNATVLILGETGVGKNRVAEYLHNHSERRTKSMVRVDCAALSASLIESELFGYERGAFTGANRAGKRGKVELADGGTLFLDEIGELPLGLQAKLLDFIQSKRFTRVGGTESIQVNTRILAATNRDLQQMVQLGTFRQDLFYRLCVIPITVPPLCQHVEDIPELTLHLIKKFSELHHLPIKQITDDALTHLQGQPWPGNIRELENLIERLVILHPHSVITSEGLTSFLSRDVTVSQESSTLTPEQCKGIPNQGLRKHLEVIERDIFEHAVSLYSSTYEIAKALQISQPTVVRKLKYYGLNK